MTKSTTRKLEAAHHRWLRKILNISWKDKVTNEKVRELAQQGILEDIISERRLRWAGHVMRMDSRRLRWAGHVMRMDSWSLRWVGHVMRIDSRRIASQSTNWKLIDDRRRPGQPRTDWQQTVEVDVRRGGISWEQIKNSKLDKS